MEQSQEMSTGGKKVKLYGLYGMVAAAASFLGMAVCNAQTASGIVLTSSVVTGAKAGLGDAVATIQTTLNNQYLIEVAILFIGLAVVVGFVMHVLKGHRKI